MGQLVQVEEMTRNGMLLKKIKHPTIFEVVYADARHQTQASQGLLEQPRHLCVSICVCNWKARGDQQLD